VFMIVGGHRAVLAACLDSFAAIPLLSGPDLIERGVWLVLDALRVGGEVALRVAAPVLLTLFLVNVVLGFIGRVLPQLNVTVLGFSLKGLVVFVVAAVALPASMEAFVGGLEMVMELARSVLN
ncbi:MAG TPA: flagellar biosynthetic protein FliR, partial [Phycisphaerae bacterium]|nr:flagellar biosynthetic protein FliR [Phycisphaerae bacterium]